MRERCRLCHDEYDKCRAEYRELDVLDRIIFLEAHPILKHSKPNEVSRHYGTGCRYSMCTRHCTCTQASAVEFRALRREDIHSGEARHERSHCRRCNTSTGHRHARFVQFHELPYGTHGMHRLTETKCAVHCDHMECVEVLPCSERTFPIVLRRCDSCMQLHDVGDMTDSRCNRCHYSNTNEMRVCSNGTCCGWQYPGNLCTNCGACHNENEPNVPQHCNCIAVTRPRLVRCLTHYDHLNESHLHTCDATNPVPRGIGVEIEVFGFIKPKRSALEHLYNVCLERKASIGTDGSVGESGIEIRTAPIIGKIAVEHITTICDALATANAVVNWKCGLHVHVDVRNGPDFMLSPDRYRPWGLFNGLDTLIPAWRLVEDAFYAMVPPERYTPRADDRQMYCKKLFAGRTWLDEENALHYAMARGWFGAARAMIRDRYHGFNIQAFDKYQTVEFRLHEGTINAQDILSWAMLCAAFVDTCVKAEKPEELLSSIMDMGPVSFLQYIAPTQAARDYVTRRNV